MGFEKNRGCDMSVWREIDLLRFCLVTSDKLTTHCMQFYVLR